MSDEPGAGRDREDRVRRLLADARHDAPVPADVAARIDEALRGLRTGDAAEEVTAAPAAAPAGHPSDELAARRRRRRWTAGLSAAAVVVVVGVGAGATGLLGSGSDVGGSSESGAGADSAEDLGEATSELPGTEPDGARTQDRDPDRPADGRSVGPFEEFGAEARPGRVPVLRSGPGLPADVAAAVREAPAVERARGDDTGCAPAGTAGKVVDVRWDDVRAELVLGEPSGGSREVSLYSCAGAPGPPDRVLSVPVR